MAVAVAEGAHVHTVDVNLAFLYADIDEAVYMSPPRGVSWDRDSHGRPLVRRVLKAIYGFKQSPAKWYEKADGVLTAFGLRATLSDPCVYVLDRDGVRLYLGM
mmetsp:Transcript_10119/g.33099  ORF Transcript_10119/g.33099 Transcript_10119/m.33099 type:complete len:103 (-) Transcript_10119:1593-1901(-)